MSLLLRLPRVKESICKSKIHTCKLEKHYLLKQRDVNSIVGNGSFRVRLQKIQKSTKTAHHWVGGLQAIKAGTFPYGKGGGSIVISSLMGEGFLIISVALVSIGFSPVQAISSLIAGAPFRKVPGIGKNPAIFS